MYATNLTKYFYHLYTSSLTEGISPQEQYLSSQSWSAALNTHDSTTLDFDLIDDLFPQMASQHTTTEHTTDLPPLAQQWITEASPSAMEKVAMCDFPQLSCQRCCSLWCMKKLNISCLQACRLHYHTMSQHASRLWLATILKNQPNGHKMFYIFSMVSPLLLSNEHSLIIHQKVCRRAFLWAYGSSENKLMNCGNMVTLCSGKRCSDNGLWTHAWISMYTEMVLFFV
jgi:hypothetical protein